MKSLQLLTLAMAAVISGALHAAVSEREAAKLGTQLTPTGAEMAGNAEGTIPAWTGGLQLPPAYIGSNGALKDPFADEKPLFVITNQNHEQYAKSLTAGQIAMLKRYPDTYQLPVYPTHRTVNFPDSVVAAAKRNATKTTLVTGGNGLKDFEISVPFPIPQNAIEVVWNHITRYRGGSVRGNFMQTVPLANGTYNPVFMRMQFSYRDLLSDFNPAESRNVLFYFKQQILAPARLAGNVILSHETLNQVEEPRKAWIYNSGQRRVRRAPQLSYDGPYPGAEGQRVYDNLDMFNGAPDRYDWKILEKREVYIPYNNYTLDSPELKYSDIVKPGHLNPRTTRYELHRVWVIQANLKAGERHIYAKRELYVDEDSWQIMLADHYDARGNLWRAGEGFLTQYYDRKIPFTNAETLYDLTNGRYFVSGLRNEEKAPLEFGFKANAAEYTPAALRNAGVR